MNNQFDNCQIIIHTYSLITEVCQNQLKVKLDMTYFGKVQNKYLNLKFPFKDLSISRGQNAIMKQHNSFCSNTILLSLLKFYFYKLNTHKMLLRILLTCTYDQSRKITRYINLRQVRLSLQRAITWLAYTDIKRIGCMRYRIEFS